MKKILLVMFGLFLSSLCFAGTNTTYMKNLKSSGAIAADTAYTLDTYNDDISYLAFQAIYSTVTIVGIYCTTTSVSAANDTIVSSVTYATGFAVLFASTSFTMTGLANDTTYYVIPASTGYIKLATSKANASAGTAIDIGLGSNSGTFTLEPANAFSDCGFRWEASNDNANWYAINVSSITITESTASTNYLWDFGKIAYRYLRANFMSGTFGAINLSIIGNSKD